MPNLRLINGEPLMLEARTVRKQQRICSDLPIPTFIGRPKELESSFWGQSFALACLRDLFGLISVPNESDRPLRVFVSKIDWPGIQHLK